MSFDTTDFQTDVIDNSHQIPVLVDFWAAWCGPCQILGPVLEKIATEQSDRFRFVKVDTEAYPEISAQYGVRGIPNVKLFHRGEVINEFTGALPEQMILDWLKTALPSEHADRVAEARRLVMSGALQQARPILEEILNAEPDNDESRILLARVYLIIEAERVDGILEPFKQGHPDYDTAAALRTLAAFLLMDLNSDPDMDQAFIDAREKFRQPDAEAVFDYLLNAMRTDKSYRDELARRLILAMFKYVGDTDPLVMQVRPKFSQLLYI